MLNAFLAWDVEMRFSSSFLPSPFHPFVSSRNPSRCPLSRTGLSQWPPSLLGPSTGMCLQLEGPKESSSSSPTSSPYTHRDQGSAKVQRTSPHGAAVFLNLQFREAEDTP